MHSPRVLHVTDFAAPYPGAFIRQLRMLDEELRGRGCAPSAFALQDPACDLPWASELRESGCDVSPLPPGTSRAERPVAHALAGTIERLRPDVVHVHFGTYDLSAARAIRTLRSAGARAGNAALVWHYRTALEVPVCERGVTRRLKDRLKYVHGARDVELCVGVTDALAREVAERGLGGRARGIVAGCDTDTFHADPRARAEVRATLGVREDEVLVLHMGWAWYRKGGDLLVEAARRLEARGDASGARFVFASIGAPDGVDVGPVRRLAMTPDVHALHQASDVFVSASRSEGFGNGLVEAMACGNVAVAAMAAGQVETFHDIPSVAAVPVDDAGAIVAALERLMTQREHWPELGEQGRSHVLENHSMRRWAREMADAYEELRPPARAAATHREVA